MQRRRCKLSLPLLQQLVIMLLSQSHLHCRLVATDCVLTVSVYTDVDECSYGNGVTSSGGPCGSYSTCFNTVGSYSCRCNDGYYLKDSGFLQRPYCTGAPNPPCKRLYSTIALSQVAAVMVAIACITAAAQIIPSY